MNGKFVSVLEVIQNVKCGSVKVLIVFLLSITNLGNLDHDPVQNSMGLANPLWPTRKGTKLQKITQIRLAGEVVWSLCCLAAEGYLSTRKEEYSYW